MEFFTKNNNSNFPDTLFKEVNGLKELSRYIDNNYLHLPNIYSVSNNLLELEKIDSTYSNSELSKKLGIGLALLHKQKQKQYGFYEDNYIGLNPQKNIWSSNWGEFFVKYRLEYQISLIKDLQIKLEFQSSLKENKTKLIEFLNSTTSHPSIVHGDLWSGNVLYSSDKVYLIDSACYYGDREVDIAMSEMFGGFHNDFYKSYNETYPLTSQYPMKKEIYNLYHYLNHYNLFGNSYLNETRDKLDKLIHLK